MFSCSKATNEVNYSRRSSSASRSAATTSTAATEPDTPPASSVWRRYSEQGGGTSSYREIEETDVIVLWGSNARETHPIFFHHVLKAIGRGAKLVRDRPAPHASATGPTCWLGLDVGTRHRPRQRRGREILAAGLEQPAFIERATSGFDLREHVRRGVLPSSAGEPCHRRPGCDAIRELAHDYARADRAMICWTLGITEHHNAVDNVLSLINLALLTGHVGRWGSGLNPLRGQNNVQGGGDMGALPTSSRLPGRRGPRDPREVRARVGRPSRPKKGWHLTEMFDAMERGELTALYVIGENPAQSEADGSTRRACSRASTTSSCRTSS
jgi:predicted molibdopterin-dependent oxidoreductase YjgC